MLKASSEVCTEATPRATLARNARHCKSTDRPARNCRSLEGRSFAGAADRLRRIAVEPILEVNGGLSKSSQASLQRATPPGCITESDGFSCGRRRKGGFPVCPATKGKGHIAIGAEADIWDGRHPSFGQVRFILASRVLGHVLRWLTTFRAWRDSLFVHRDTSYNNPSIPFEFTSENLKRAEEIIGCVPPF